jgi:catechol 2,3-dioxygenase-like lactoylglutathione lyase family enzyme
MEFERIDHVALDVTDRSAAVAFYTGVLGMDAGADPGEPGEPVFIRGGGASLALFNDPGREIRHVALRTDRAGFEATRRRLEEHGIEHRHERHTRNDSIYFADPSGNRIEVLTPRE